MNCYLTAILVFGLFMFLRKTNGHSYCKDDNNAITSCDGSYKSGTNVNVNLNRPCSCTVNALFTGELLVTVFKDASYLCTTEVIVSSGTTTSVFQCTSKYPLSISVDVKTNETVVNVKIHYTADYTPGNSSFCLGIDGRGGTVRVTCGNSTTATTTKATTTTTIPAAKTTTTTTTASSKPKTTTTTTSAKTSSSKPGTATITTATTAETISLSKPETSSSTTTYNATTVVDPSPQKSTYASSDNVTYIFAGAAAGGLVLVVVVIVAIIVLRKKKGRTNYQTQKTNETSEHTNMAFDENNYGLPDNPLYHSAQLMDEVGYSSVQKDQLGLPPIGATIKKNKDPNYDIPTNNKPINDSDTSPMPIYAVPNRSGASPPEENEPQAMYAQVLKPSKSTTQVPMQSINQGGLV